MILYFTISCLAILIVLLIIKKRRDEKIMRYIKKKMKKTNLQDLENDIDKKLNKIKENLT